MSVKTMSFGKLMAIFGGFFVTILVVAVVVMKSTNKNAPSGVVTKTYTPANKPEAPAPANPQIEAATQAQAAAQAQAQAQAQAALQPPQPATASTDTPPVVPHSDNHASPASQSAPVQSQQPDMAQHLASIDSQLASIQKRLSAVEGSRGSGDAVAPSHPAKRVRRAHVASRASMHASPALETRRAPSKETEVQALAVVGNRAWVRGADGIEESVKTGDTMPVPRPRVRSVDASTGVVIMSSDAD